MIDYEIHPGTSDRTTRTVYDAPPAIRRVRIDDWSGDAAITGSYAHLWDAEEALRRAVRADLDAMGGRVVALVTVEWTDGASHETSVEIGRPASGLAQAASFGFIKAHLMRQGKRFIDAEDDPVLQAWGAELRTRLASDRSDPETRAADQAWANDHAFSSSGAGSPPVSSVTVTHEPETSRAATADYASIDDAEVALRGLRGVHVVGVRVAWADGLRISVWDSLVNVHEAQRNPDGYIRPEIAAQARRILAEDYAEKNARTLPRRPLEPQRHWARELLRRIALAAAPPPRARTPRGARNAVSSTDAPRIVAVTIGWSENGAVRAMMPKVYPSLSAADAALRRAFDREPVVGGYDKTDYGVRWSDGQTHEGRLDVSPQSLAAAAARGLLRAHLDNVARWLTSDDYVRLWVGLGRTDDIESKRAWGFELTRRLERDLAAHLAQAPGRNAARARAGGAR